MAKKKNTKKLRKPKKPKQQLANKKAGQDKLYTPFNDRKFYRVDRVFDTLVNMNKRNQIDDRQFAAAEKYRKAYETCHGNLKSPLDDSKVGGGSQSGRMPAPNSMFAAEVLREARIALGPKYKRVVEYVAGNGYSIEEAAHKIYRCKSTDRPTKTQREKTGERLREALSKLAQAWFGDPKRQRLHPFYAPDWVRPEISPDAPRIAKVEMDLDVVSAGYDNRGRPFIKGEVPVK